MKISRIMAGLTLAMAATIVGLFYAAGAFASDLTVKERMEQKKQELGIFPGDNNLSKSYCQEILTKATRKFDDASRHIMMARDAGSTGSTMGDSFERRAKDDYNYGVQIMLEGGYECIRLHPFDGAARSAKWAMKDYHDNHSAIKGR